MQPRDQLQRPLRSLRLSVTDRCNLRCSYCMPEPSYTWLPRAQLLDFDELVRVARAAIALGVNRIRVTGGEPLLRRDLDHLLQELRRLDHAIDLALTTNGLLLADNAPALATAGLDRVTVSLDTLKPERFEALTGQPGLERALAGIDAAITAGLMPLKLDAVVLAGVNDDELGDLLDFARSRNAELRFIEYMDVGGATGWRPDAVVPRETILERVSEHVGAIPTPLADRGSAPAERFALPDGSTFGVIASTTAPFCAACDRARLTADGMMFPCLYASQGLDLKTVLRSGADDDQLRQALTEFWTARADRGAEERLQQPERGALIPADALRRNPHLEMHTRGG